MKKHTQRNVNQKDSVNVYIVHLCVSAHHIHLQQYIIKICIFLNIDLYKFSLLQKVCLCVF